MKHYRLFWFTEQTKFDPQILRFVRPEFITRIRANSARLAVLAIVIAAVVLPSSQASSQAPDTTVASIADANRKGWEAYNRKDYVSAMQSYRKAADQGDAAAQDMVARLYSIGLGVPKNDQEALNWFRKSADQGYAEGQAGLCGMYITGSGVKIDHEQGVAWCMKAAEQGHARAQGLIGLEYLSGEGLPKNNSKAAIWLRKAADQGDAQAQTMLGSCYRNGVGVPKDIDQARAWYRKASAQGYEDAKTKLAELKSETHQKASMQFSEIPDALRFKCMIMVDPQRGAMKPGKDQEIWQGRYKACVKKNWKELYGNDPFPD